VTLSPRRARLRIVQVVRDSWPGGHWELWSRPAAADLAPYVTGLQGFVEHGGPTRRRELPTGRAVLIVGTGPALRVQDAGCAPVALGAFLAGPAAAPAVTEHDGEMRGVQVDLSPPAARMLAGVPLHELGGVSVALEDLLGPPARELAEHLHETAGWPARLALVEAAVARRLAQASPPPPDVLWAWRRLVAAHGLVRVEALAAELGCSRRHLALRFREHVGLAPKTAARVLRFARLVELTRARPERWADLAAICGYADQPHLNREVRALAGSTPGELLARTLPAGRGVAG
jgi:AraC-like DNA-binding protein